MVPNDTGWRIPIIPSRAKHMTAASEAHRAEPCRLVRGIAAVSIVLFGVTASICAGAASEAFAQSGGGGQGTGDGATTPGTEQRPAPSDVDRSDAPPPPQSLLTPHCGQYLTTPTDTYEVVFTLFQLRVYAYDKAMRPQNAKHLRVQLTLTVPGEDDVRRIPFQYVAASAGSGEQAYLAASFDFARLGDKEVPLMLEFFSPDRRHPVSFSPLFTRGSLRPYVAHVEATEADRNRMAQQRVCPVSGDALGSKGQTVKILVGEHPLYLCSKECIVAVKRSPEKYLPQPKPPAAGPPK